MKIKGECKKSEGGPQQGAHWNEEWGRRGDPRKKTKFGTTYFDGGKQLRKLLRPDSRGVSKEGLHLVAAQLEKVWSRAKGGTT